MATRGFGIFLSRCSSKVSVCAVPAQNADSFEGLRTILHSIYEGQLLRCVAIIVRSACLYGQVLAPLAQNHPFVSMICAEGL